MKKIIIILVAAFSLFALQSNAQWAVNGTDIYNTNTGNVGIGTTTPSEDLHIYDATGPSKLVLESPFSSGNRTIGNYDIVNSTSGDLLRIVLRLKNGNHEMVQSAYSSSRDAWIPYMYLNYTTGKYEMRTGITEAEFKNQGNILFNNLGSVGIGTGATIPAGAKLAVAGKINCKEVEVTLTGWADYVFSEDYNLRLLSEVETFIKENKHLPGVPNEAEVLENGLRIGEMNTILLVKIEELTLYMIDLKKENEVMKSQINELKGE